MNLLFSPSPHPSRGCKQIPRQTKVPLCSKFEVHKGPSDILVKTVYKHSICYVILSLRLAISLGVEVFLLCTGVSFVLLNKRLVYELMFFCVEGARNCSHSSAWAIPPKESAHYLLLNHFAGACRNVCSALVQKNVCRTPTPSVDTVTGRWGAVKRGWSREAKKWTRQVEKWTRQTGRWSAEREREGGRLCGHLL